MEAEVIAQGSVSGVLSGHHYNHSVRAHKLMFKALSRLRLKTFIDSCGNGEAVHCFAGGTRSKQSRANSKIYDVMGQDDFRSVDGYV